MALPKLFSQFEENMKRIETKIKYEDYKDLDVTERNLNDMKTCLTSASKTVSNYILKNIFFSSIRSIKK
jgi:hypothetical protein